MDETQWRRIMVTSSFNEMSIDQLGKRVVERVRELLRPTPPLSTSGLLERYLKTT
jgi:hypothetical protein